MQNFAFVLLAGWLPCSRRSFLLFTLSLRYMLLLFHLFALRLRESAACMVAECGNVRNLPSIGFCIHVPLCSKYRLDKCNGFTTTKPRAVSNWWFDAENPL